MAAHPKPRLTPEESLAIDRASDVRHEYYKGEMWAMAGGTPLHAQIVGNLTAELRMGLKGRGCFVMPQDLRTSVSVNGLYTFPGVVVLCGDMKYTDDRRDTITNPTLIVEVLSPSTEGFDRGIKAAQYRQIESLREYAFVSQAEARVEVYRRQAAGHWDFTEFAGLEATCAFESVNCRIPLAEIYYLVAFDEAGARPFEARSPGAG